MPAQKVSIKTAFGKKKRKGRKGAENGGGRPGKQASASVNTTHPSAVGATTPCSLEVRN